MECRYCPRCGETKPLTEFVKNRAAKNGLHGWCKECCRKSTKQWLSANPDYTRSWKEGKGRKKHMLSVVRARATRRGIECTITEDDFEIPEFCPILGIRLVMGHEVPGEDSMTLDRMDNRRGYVPGNVHVISRKANMMKTNASREELIQFADWVYKTFGGI